MARVFKPRADAIEHPPAENEVFGDIVKNKCEDADPKITLEEVALFNWGTKDKKEIVRALVELIGCKEVDEADPAKCKLDPARGPGGGAKILLPRVLKKENLALDTTHTLKVTKPLPATAIAITSLDKWFLPNDETCDVGWRVEGLEARATKLDMEVYASSYAKATATVNGEFVSYTYADLPDTPILKKELNAKATERSTGTETSWKGESDAADGILKPRGDVKRYVNAASSPYTVMLRYYKDPDHKKAVLRVGSFWPRWSGSGASRAVVDDSLKFTWTLKDCPAGLQGQFQIFDKDGVIVWRQALTPVECGNGDHTHDWSSGKTLITEAKMPYRVQIQVHTALDKDPGMGLAAMHTEVRLFTHPEVGTHADDHEREPQVLAFAMAPFYSYNGDAPAEDSAKGRKLRLAKAGYHPGPIEDGEAQAPYVMAIKEFQRDHAKPKVTRALLADIPLERLRANGVITDETKRLITAQAAGRRPLYATSARVDITDEAALRTSLNDKATSIIAWVDDRHNYTTAGADYSAYYAPNMGLEDYRGPQDAGVDCKQAADERSISRSWLPVEVRIPLMKKSDTLQDANPTVPEVTDSMRNALGPIRVDWTFRDLPPEYRVNAAEYNATRVRSLAFLTAAIDADKGTHNGKDACNCPEPRGGLRGADYFKAPFGFDDKSLMPWKAEADAGVSTVCSVAHDDLGQDAAQVFAARRGTAGMYLRPSIIAGDGYQFRAQVSFRDMPTAATHPNWKVLRDRYDATKLPQAHSAPIRLWRKDSLRGHVQWTTPTNWGTHDVRVRDFYEPAMVHFAQEETSASIRPTALYAGRSGTNAYKDLIAGYVTGTMGQNPKTDHYRPKSEMELSDDYLWPWTTAKHLGVQFVPPTGTAVGGYWAAFWDTIDGETWSPFCDPLAYDMLAKFELANAALRGHLIGEFRSSPAWYAEKYLCTRSNTHDQLLLETSPTGGSGIGEGCRFPNCTGTLVSSIMEDYECDRCQATTRASITLNTAGKACTTPCSGTLQRTNQAPVGFFRGLVSASGSVQSTYTCDKCGRTHTSVDASAAAAAVTIACGQVCPRHGTMRAVAGSRTAQDISGVTNGLPMASWGGALGTLFLDTAEAARTFWAHEIGHHKHLSHAGDVIAHAASPSQHDRAANTVSAAVQAAGDVNTQKWDRDCIMSYVNTDAGDDRGYFCGKCLLKLRGWKVEGIADPAGNVAGP